jgi:hypothetical protein
MSGQTDWVKWHEKYEGELAPRLATVQKMLRIALPGAERVISACAGDGRDLLPLLEPQMRARLIEIHPELCARVPRLPNIEVVCADAGSSDAYVGAVPADVVLACGIFGNISDADVERTVRSLPQICAEGGRVVWTRHRWEPDLTPAIRRWFAETGFEELAFESAGSEGWSVGLHVSRIPVQPLRPAERLFTFLR